MTKKEVRIMMQLRFIEMVQELIGDKDATLMLGLSPSEMKKQNTEPMFDVLNALLMSDETVRSLRNRLEFSWSNFTDEDKDFDELPYVKIFFETISKEFPFWFWFVSKEDSSSDLKWMFYFLSKPDSVTNSEERKNISRRYSNEEIAEFMTKYAMATRKLQRVFDISEDEIESNLKDVEKYYHRILPDFDWSQISKNVFSQ